MNIYQHLSYRTLIEDWFQYKKETNTRFSYRLASRLIKSKSPSFIKDVIKGTVSVCGDETINLTNPDQALP